MKPVGIIVHSASGKDIRRIIAKGSTTTNQEKTNSIVRMILAMDAVGVDNVEIMPDSTNIGRRIIKDIEGQLQHTAVSLLPLPYVIGTQEDTLRAATMMSDANFACMIVMGGDGTCRVAAKGAANTPMLPVSTGTNNVFPQIVEGTLVGLAAGYLATEAVQPSGCCHLKPVLNLKKDGELKDIALVDLVTVGSADTASRAVWEVASIRELFLTHAQPDSIGLSSIGGWLDPLGPEDKQALHITLGKGADQVLAPIAPGLLAAVPIEHCQRFDERQELVIQSSSCVVALDGEREVVIAAGEHWTVEYSENGPLVVDISKTLKLASG